MNLAVLEVTPNDFNAGAVGVYGNFAIERAARPQVQDLMLYARYPAIGQGARAQICWQADDGYELSLEFLRDGEPCVLAGRQGVGPGPGTFSMVLWQRTLFTLTASVGDVVVARRELWIEVAPRG